MPETQNNPPKAKASNKTRRKLWLIGIFAVFALLLIALTSIDLNQVKDSLIAKYSAESGMKIEIESIALGFAHGLGLKCSGVKIVTPTGETYAVDHLHLLAEWAPLLRGEFKINSATLDRPQLTLNLSETPAKEPAVGKKLQKDTEPAPASPVESIQNILKESQLSVRHFKISDGQVILKQMGQELSARIDLSLQLVQVSEDRLDVLIDSIKISTGGIQLQGKAKGENLTAENANLSFDMQTKSFALDDIKPLLAFFAKENLIAPVSELQIENISLSVQTPLAALDQIDNLKQQSSGNFNFNIKKTALNLAANPLQFEPLEGEGKWSNGILHSDLKGSILGSEFGIKSELPLSGKNIKADVRWKNLDITRLPLPTSKSWHPVAGNVSGTLNFSGPLPATENPLHINSKGKLNFQFKELVLANSSKKISLPQLAGKADYKNSKLDYQFTGDIFAGNFKSIGTMAISSTNSPDIDNQTEFTNLDLSKLDLLKPGIGIPTQGIASGKVKLKGPMPKDGKLDNFDIETSFNVTDLSLPVEQDQKTFALVIARLKGKARLHKNKLTHDINAQMLGGSFGASGSLKLGNKIIADTTLKLQMIDLSSLEQLEKSVYGIISADIKLKGPLPENGKFFASGLKIDTIFDLKNLSLPLEIKGKTVNAEVSRLKGSASLHNNNLQHDITAKLLGGNVSAKGNLGLKEMNIDTVLGLEHIDLAWIQGIKKGDWIPVSGKLTGQLKIKGPLADKNVNIKPSGTLTASKLILGTGEKKNEFETARLTLKNSSVELTQALLEIDKIKAAGVHLKKIKAQFRIRQNQIDLTEGRIWPKSGQLKLAGSFQPSSGAYRLRFKGEKLKVEDFLQQLAGPLNLEGKLTGVLPENSAGFPDIAKELSGQVKINLHDGSLPELGALETLLTILNPTTVLDAKNTGLNYKSLGGDFKIGKGLVHTDNLEMKSPQLNIQVVGDANLAADTINMQVKAMPLQMLDKVIKAIPLLGQILTGGKKGGLIETYFKVDGKLSEPNVTLQPHKSLIGKPGSILNELFKIPGNLTGGK